jgi:uncharacterized protein (DUF58 family)
MSVATRAIPEGIRITKVGLWYILITLIVAVAATNTGNNSLYMVWAAMLGALVVSGVLSRQNVRCLAVSLEPPPEVFAKRPFAVRYRLTNRGRLLPRWFLLFNVARQGPPWLLPYLPCGGTGRGEVEVMLPRRGRHRLDAVHLSSIFPFGLFSKGARYPLDVEVLVYPELFPASHEEPAEAGDLGSEPIRRRGWGHELHSLRRFRQGDDPRSIHWKQTARTGRMIVMEREAEESRRLSVILDNGVGVLEDEAAQERFERLVSEAATAAVDALGRGWEVELVTRERRLPFAGGARQRLRLLEALALVEPVPRASERLTGSDPRAPQLRLGPNALAERREAS